MSSGIPGGIVWEAFSHVWPGYATQRIKADSPDRTSECSVAVSHPRPFHPILLTYIYVRCTAMYVAGFVHEICTVDRLVYTIPQRQSSPFNVTPSLRAFDGELACATVIGTFLDVAESTKFCRNRVADPRDLFDGRTTGGTSDTFG